MDKTMRTWIAVFTLGIASVALGSTVADFKGVPFGASERAFAAKLSGYKCRTLPTPGDRVCSITGDTFATLPSIVIAAFFFGDRFGGLMAEIDSSAYDAAAAAMTEKFGEPKKDQGHGPLRRTVWKSGNVAVEGTALEWSSGHAKFFYTADFMIAEFQRRKDEKAAQDKKDL